MKKSNERIHRYISKDFANLLDEIKRMRIELKKEMLNPVADWRITLAMKRHPLMIKIEKDIINAELK